MQAGTPATVEQPPIAHWPANNSEYDKYPENNIPTTEIPSMVFKASFGFIISNNTSGLIFLTFPWRDRGILLFYIGRVIIAWLGFGFIM